MLPRRLGRVRRGGTRWRFRGARGGVAAGDNSGGLTMMARHSTGMAAHTQKRLLSTRSVQTSKARHPARLGHTLGWR